MGGSSLMPHLIVQLQTLLSEEWVPFRSTSSVIESLGFLQPTISAFHMAMPSVDGGRVPSPDHRATSSQEILRSHLVASQMQRIIS